jgi:hypothetical protein
MVGGVLPLELGEGQISPIKGVKLDFLLSGFHLPPFFAKNTVKLCSGKVGRLARRGRVESSRRAGLKRRNAENQLKLIIYTYKTII